MTSAPVASTPASAATSGTPASATGAVTIAAVSVPGGNRRGGTMVSGGTGHVVQGFRSGTFNTRPMRSRLFDSPLAFLMDVTLEP